ncbi:beta-galactosidase [Opitutaceae bacterium TAV5]|nr:beta-galactosidase [Opitutaceae bacterium TAV5]
MLCRATRDQRIGSCFSLHLKTHFFTFLCTPLLMLPPSSPADAVAASGAPATPAPIADGLPAPLPPSAKAPWKSRFTLTNGVLFKDDAPFYPIGFVFGTSDADLAQARAMGANAVHFDIGWNTAPRPGDIPDASFDKVRGMIRRAADWNMAVIPLLTGHYVPGWFQRAYPASEHAPVGSDGKRTGSWTPYSLHSPALREHIPAFWRATAAMVAAEPNVIGIGAWNEPGYGGTWNRGDQFAEYSQWAVAAWRDHLRTTFTTLDALNRAHGTGFATWDDVQPPRQPEAFNRRAWLDWMEFGQRAFAGFFAWERTIIKEAAPALLLTNKKQTNPWDRSTASSGTNWELMGRSEDIFGINLYSGSPFGTRNILDAASSYADGRPVMIFEINSMPPGAEARTPDTIRTLLWAPLAGGARGMFIFAFIRDTEHGILGPGGANAEGRAEYTRLLMQISAHQRELASPRVAGRIGIVYSTTAALQSTGDLVPRHASGAFSLFRNSHYQVDYIPEERCTPDYLKRYTLVVLPTATVLKPRETAAVQTYLADGGRLWAFGDSLARDELWAAQPPPAFLGLKDRKPPIGDRRHQQIGKVDSALESYFEGDCQIGGVEMVSAVVGDADAILPGAEIRTATHGRVLAWNSDSYPTLLQTSTGGRVIYSAFSSDYSAALRGLVEGITREIIGLRQEARLVGNATDMTASAVITGLREDYQDPSLRYLIAINTAWRPQKTRLELPEGWSLQGEALHNENHKTTPTHATLNADSLTLAPREVYLFTLKKRG